jgi:two-component system, LytTR family, sensor kinase
VPLFKQPKFQLSFIALLVSISLVHGWLILHQGYSWTISTTESTIGFVLLYGLCALQGNILTYYTPTKSRQFYIIGWALILATIWAFGLWFAMRLIFPTEIIYLNDLYTNILLRIFISLLFISAIGFYNLLWQIQEQQSILQNNQNSIKELAKDAELFKLRQQIHPHFLFNSLNSITALITLDPPKARKMIQLLSEFLRATLRKEDKELISLEDELHYIRVYLEIEKVRFGHRLETFFNVPDDLLKCKVPNLILQPVLENAIKYGLYNQLGLVSINVEAHLKGNELLLKVTNPFDQLEVPSNKGTGFGLTSIKRRLQLVYGVPQLLQISQTNSIFTTQLTIPQL